MAIKLSGMISGMDTDAMIDELVSAYSVRKDSYVKAQKSLTYKQDAWKEMNTKIYSLFSGKLSNLRFSTNYSLKTTKASNSDKATISASSNAVNGTQELKITSLAKSGYLTGGVVKSTSGEDLKGSSKLSELGITSGRINVSVEGKETYIDINGDTTINNLVVALKERGLNASFDEKNRRFFISSKTSGTQYDFSISGNDATGTDALKKLGLYTVTSTDISAFSEYIDAVDGDAEYMTNQAKNEYLNALINSKVTELNTERKGYSDKVTELTENITAEKAKKTFAALSDEEKEKKISELSDKITALNKKISEENAKDDPDAAAIEGYEKEIATLSEQISDYEQIKTAVGSSSADDFKTKLEEYNKEIDERIKATSEEIDAEGEKIKAVDEKIATASANLSATIDDKEKYLADNSIDVDYTSAEYNDVYSKYSEKYSYAKEMVAAYEEYENLSNSASPDTARLAELKEKLGLNQDETGATRVVGADAKIYLNGAMFESNTNNFQINGLTITAHALTEEDETISITTATDVDGIYNMVKNFFKEYNELMKGMEEAYNAASAGSYEPLTDEEMEAMTDKQIEKWEDKLKTAALRKDETLSSVISLLKNGMMKSYEVDGEKLNLASFGIKTLSYFQAADNEKGLYHIDGDADDSATSGNEDKLKAAIASEPEKFVKFFTQLTGSVYEQLNKKMSTSTLSSAYTIYNDKLMKKQYDDYSDTISEWEDKLDSIREKYEKQFAAMESALSQLQSKSSYFSSMLGG